MEEEEAVSALAALADASIAAAVPAEADATITDALLTSELFPLAEAAVSESSSDIAGTGDAAGGGEQLAPLASEQGEASPDHGGETGRSVEGTDGGVAQRPQDAVSEEQPDANTTPQQDASGEQMHDNRDATLPLGGGDTAAATVDTPVPATDDTADTPQAQDTAFPSAADVPQAQDTASPSAADVPQEQDGTVPTSDGTADPPQDKNTPAVAPPDASDTASPGAPSPHPATEAPDTAVPVTHDTATASPHEEVAASNPSQQHPQSPREEYDPENPSMDSRDTSQVTPPAADGSAQTNTGDSDVHMTDVATVPLKRKPDIDAALASGAPSEQTEHTPKRARTDSSNSDNKHHESEGKSSAASRERRESASSTTSPRHHQKGDHKGLCEAAWDRLMDFQTSGDFRVTQVSRAAFTAVGALPEFAQITIIARFTRTRMEGVRDKNGQLMRVLREYQKENPHIAALQSVDAYIADYSSDAGLFLHGYAPPQPLTGVSSTALPFQYDESENGVRTPARLVTPTAASRKPDTDEFGRNINISSRPGEAVDPVQTQAVAAAPIRQESAPRSRATDPRRAVLPDQQPSTIARVAHPAPVLSASQGNGTVPPPQAGRPQDPRRRDTSETSRAAQQFAGDIHRPEDPRRQVMPAAQPSYDSRFGGDQNEMFSRLPPTIRTILDGMLRDGRLREPLNDNVVSRLLHLPEHVAMRAVENFSTVDLTHVGNVQGFFVGIMNRVNEKSIAAENHAVQGSHDRRGPVQATGYYPPQGGMAEAPQQMQQPNYMRGAGGGAYPDLQNRQGDGGYMDRSNGGLMAAPTQHHQHPLGAAGDHRIAQPRLDNSAAAGPSSQGGWLGTLPISVQTHLQTLVADGTLASIDEFGDKCYEVLSQLSEPLANEVLDRFANANLSSVRNRSGFLIGVVKRCRQEYGFN